MKYSSMLLLSLTLAGGSAWADGDGRTAVGGALGGVLGSVVGQAVGGGTGSTIGAGLGGAAGGAVSANHGSRTEAAIGGGLGAAGGNAVGRTLGGTTGGLVGAGLGGAVGGALGNNIGDRNTREERYSDRRGYYGGHHDHGSPPPGGAPAPTNNLPRPWPAWVARPRRAPRGGRPAQQPHNRPIIDTGKAQAALGHRGSLSRRAPSQ